jgi:hypothetical protein
MHRRTTDSQRNDCCRDGDEVDLMPADRRLKSKGPTVYPMSAKLGNP